MLETGQNCELINKHRAVVSSQAIAPSRNLPAMTLMRQIVAFVAPWSYRYYPGRLRIMRSILGLSKEGTAQVVYNRTSLSLPVCLALFNHLMRVSREAAKLAGEVQAYMVARAEVVKRQPRHGMYKANRERARRIIRKARAAGLVPTVEQVKAAEDPRGVPAPTGLPEGAVPIGRKPT